MSGTARQFYRGLAGLVIVVVVLLAILFEPALTGNELPLGSDYNFTSAVTSGRLLAGRFFDNLWDNTWLLGGSIGLYMPAVFYVISMLATPAAAYLLNYLVPVMLAALGAYILFARGYGWPILVSVCLSTLFAFSTNFVSLMCPMHLGKLYTLAFFPLALHFVHQATWKGLNPVRNYLLAGFFLGSAFLQGETPIALYFSAVLGAYFVMSLLRRGGAQDANQGTAISIVKAALPFMLVPLVTGALCYPLLLQQSGSTIGMPAADSVPTLKQTEAPDQKRDWLWATQWSLPPEETLDFFVPCVFGTQSSDPNCPYWGRTGRTEGWTLDNRQGFNNFSQLSSYLGFVIAFLAVLSLFVARDRITLFWGGVALLALLLALGKYAPLYRLLYALPTMASIRNPNRFVHLVYFAGTIMAGKALVACVQALSAPDGQARARIARSALRLCAVFAVAGGLGFLGFLAGNGALHASLDPLFGPELAGRLLQNSGAMFLRFVCFTAACAALFWISFQKRFRLPAPAAVLAGGLLLIGSIDLTLVNHRFIRFGTPPLTTPQDPLTEFLVSHRDAQNPSRVKLITRGPTLNWFINQNIPLFGLESSDVTAVRQLPPDLDTFFREMKPDALRTYALQNVRYFLSEKPYQLFGLKPSHQFPGYTQGASVYLYENPECLPRVYLVNRVRVEPDLDAFFRLLNSAEFKPAEEAVLMHDAPFVRDMAGGPASGSATSSRVTVRSHSDQRIQVSARNESPAMLVVTDLYHPTWEALVDGKPEPIVRANYLFRGVYLRPGEHEIVFRMRRTFVNQVLPLVLFCAVGAFFLYTAASALAQDIRGR